MGNDLRHYFRLISGADGGMNPSENSWKYTLAIGFDREYGVELIQALCVWMKV
jgi:hypothetical protein